AMFGKMKSEFSGMFAEIVTPMMAAISDMMAKVPDLAADAQRRSLATDLSPSTRVEKLSEYEWRVVGSPHPYVLPDCIAVAYDRDGNAFPLMFAEMETIDSIFAPLSSDRLLVGSRSAKAVPPSDLNDSFAACSWDFFVAESRTESFENLRRKLRTRVSQFLDETIDVALAEALRDHVGSD
ncbi:MAG: hypothetical protein JWM38_1511, partial [Sphingomonas bacterium]|nr:hypothetical protein [Sphingomonas bacterium]